MNLRCRWLLITFFTYSCSAPPSDSLGPTPSPTASVQIEEALLTASTPWVISYEINSDSPSFEYQEEPSLSLHGQYRLHHRAPRWLHPQPPIFLPRVNTCGTHHPCGCPDVPGCRARTACASSSGPCTHNSVDADNYEFLWDVLEDGASDINRVHLNITLDGGATHYLYKFGPTAGGSCWNEAGYSNLIPNGQTLRLDTDMYGETNLTLCIRGATLAGDGTVTTQPPESALEYNWVYQRLANRSLRPRATIGSVEFLSQMHHGRIEMADANIRIRSNCKTTHYQYKYGSSEYVDCYDPRGYTNKISVFQDMYLNFETLPPQEETTLCIKGSQYYSCGHGLCDQQVPSTYRWLNGEIVTGPAPFLIVTPSGSSEDTTPLVTWTPSLGADQYDLTIATDESCQQIVYAADDVTGLSLEVPDPLAPGDYFTCVIAEALSGDYTLAQNNGLPFTIEESNSPDEDRHIIFASSIRTSVTSSNAFPPVPSDTFGHLNAADWVCTYLAFNAGLITEWDNADLIYRALVSMIIQGANERVISSAAVYNTSGEKIATTFGDLWSGEMLAPVMYDEFSRAIQEDPEVWTGSNPDGTWTNLSCGTWDNPGATSTVGNATVSTDDWMRDHTVDCTTKARLYCISPLIRGN